ncbi:isopenicillin N synthase family dioxygenase [Ruicaihuangia caeni]|uniref:isopenicillin N synthase family dioxygenase n=1 Tax=Ruicaihuangia caeni TaxID=3042517 RepID=UPI00338D4FAE
MSTSTSSSLSLPVLDLSRLACGDEEAAAFRDDLRRATHEVGFFYLTGHGVPQELIDRMISVGRKFFELPEADKLALNMVDSPHFRGYTRIGGELTQGAVDWREQIDIATEREPVTDPDAEDFWVLQGPNQWPAALPELRELATEWIERLNDVSLTLLHAWAEALGAPADVFDPAFAERPAPHIKIARYPGKEDAGQGVGAHKDLGVLTLLYVEEGKGGLQVERDGQWIDAPPVSGAFVVNIGELLEIATNGYLKATMHRVVSPAPGQDRISVPYFYGPALDATIPTIDLPPELAAEARGVTRDPSNPLHPVFGKNWLKSRLRAHQDVGWAHHPELMEAQGFTRDA